MLFLDAVLKNELDKLRSRVMYTSAISTVAAGIVHEEFVDQFDQVLKASGLSLDEVYADVMAVTSEADKALTLEQMATAEYPEKMTTEELIAAAKADKDFKTNRSAEFARVDLIKKRLDIKLAFEVTSEVVKMKRKKRKQALNKVIKAILSKEAEQKKANGVIINALFNAVMNAFKLDNEHYAAYMLEVLKVQGIIDIKNVFNEKTEAHDKMVKCLIAKEDMADLVSLERKTSRRNVVFGGVDEVEEGDSVVLKHKFAYDQPADPMLDVLNIKNDTEFEFIGALDDAERLAARKLFDADKFESVSWDKIENDPERLWMLNELNAMATDIELTKQFGSFSIYTDTDGVGRMYERSDRIGLMQNSLMVHMIEFGNKHVLDSNGIKAMKLVIASKMGYDKVTAFKAYRAFKKHEQEWRDAGECEREFHILDNPDEPTGYMVELDAQTQGTQIYALLTASAELGSVSGLFNNLRTDAYAKLAEYMNFFMNVDWWTRFSVKSAFMTKLYGAGYRTLMFGSKFTDEDPEIKVEGKQIPLMHTANSNGVTDTKQVWVAFQKAMKALAPRALKTMEVIEKKAEKSSLEVIEWTMPDGVKCSVAMQQTFEEHINWIDPLGKSHTVTHHKRFLVPGSKSKAWAPRIVQSVDAYILREMVRRMDALGYDIATKHDAFFMHPNAVFTAMRVYNDIVIEVLEMDLLTDIMQQITGDVYTSFQDAEKRGKFELTADMIREFGWYAIWF